MNIPKFELNIPNLFSFSRVVLIPLFIYLVSLKTMEGWIWALVGFFIASVTDMLDGWSARKLNQESEFGQFIDPLADKFLVISALMALMILDPYLEVFDLWMIFIIAGRDVLITVMRWFALKKGRPLKTSKFGKVKTAFQMISIVLIIMIYIGKKSKFFITHASVPYWIMISVTLLTAFSGLRYLIANWELLLPDKADEKGE